MSNRPNPKIIKAFGFQVSGDFLSPCKFKPPLYILSRDYEEYFIGLEFGKYHTNALVPITDEDRDLEPLEREYTTFIENFIFEIEPSDFKNLEEHDKWIENFREQSKKSSLVIFLNDYFEEGTKR